ncbi:MAG: cobalamin-independent methionine synthase II family protein [Deltaproteobacteria bacterium]|nr:MAG: cobalamin-independent methionine synthase II family protein [Deltaproteobacteria bacterium]
MALLTTTIGSYPKPDYVPVPDWFKEESTVAKNPTEEYEAYLRTHHNKVEELLDRATREVVEEQIRVGIDIPTDGEVRRENYIHYHCRHLEGIDFSQLTRKTMRAGSWVGKVPTIVAPIRPRDIFLPKDWRTAQAVSNRPVKMTLPGPMTIVDSLADGFYDDDKILGQALAAALNKEILALVEAGCIWIQVDEPLMAREPEKAVAYGIENLERCFSGVPEEVTRATHMCCGYPDKVDNEDYPKASPDAYFKLAAPLDGAEVDAVSIEDAHRPNDLSLLDRFKNTKVILGVIAIARSRVETVEELTARFRKALGHIDNSRLLVAPDCGLGMLERDTVVQKLKNMVQAAKSV